MQYIKIYYLPGLGDFLDEEGVKWHNNGDHTILIYYTEAHDLFRLGQQYQLFYNEIFGED